MSEHEILVQHMVDVERSTASTTGSVDHSVQVNIVAVSDHVFHRFPSVSCAKCLKQLSLFSCISFVLMATDRACEDAAHTTLPRSLPLSSNVDSPNGSGSDLDGMGDFDNHQGRCHLPQLPVLNRPSMPLLPRWRCLQLCNRTSTPSQKNVSSLTACVCQKFTWT